MPKSYIMCLHIQIKHALFLIHSESMFANYLGELLFKSFNREELVYVSFFPSYNLLCNHTCAFEAKRGTIPRNNGTMILIPGHAHFSIIKIIT